MRKFQVFALAALTALLTGCGVTRTLEAPCPETAIQPFPEAWLGEWEVTDLEKSTLPTGHVTFQEDNEIPGRIVVAVTLENSGKPWPPMLGGVFTASGKRFCVALANTGAMLRQKGYDDNTAVLFQSVFLIFEVAGTPENPEFHTVTFVRKSGNDYLPVNDTVRLKDNSLVLNSTPEIYSMLEAGKYEIAGKYRLSRTAPEPGVASTLTAR